MQESTSAVDRRTEDRQAENLSTVIRSFLQRRVIAPIVAVLTQGITPEKIALSLAFGIVLGVFPVLGLTTILCAAAAVVFGLNLPSIQLVNWLTYPLQLLLFLPFIRTGEKLFRAAPLQLSIGQIVTLVRTDVAHAASILWLAEVHAIFAWLLTGPAAIFLLFVLLSKALRQLASAYGLRAGMETKC
jgi:hypothetical protein